MEQPFAMTASLSPNSLPECEKDEDSLREFYINEGVPK